MYDSYPVFIHLAHVHMSSAFNGSLAYSTSNTVMHLSVYLSRQWCHSWDKNNGSSTVSNQKLNRENEATPGWWNVYSIVNVWHYVMWTMNICSYTLIKPCIRYVNMTWPCASWIFVADGIRMRSYGWEWIWTHVTTFQSSIYASL